MIPLRGLGKTLVDNGLVSEQQLAVALKEQVRSGELLGDALVRLGFISKRDLTRVIASNSDIRYVDMKQTQIDPDAVRIVGGELARRYGIMPFSLVNDTLQITMSNPNDIIALDAIQRATGLEVEPFASDPEDIVERIDFYYRRGLTLDDEIDKAINAAMGGGMDHDGKNSPTSGLIDLIISKGLRKSATDVHFAPEYKSLRVSYRVDGILQSDTILPIALHTPIVTRLKILSNMNIAEQRLPQEGSMSIDFLGRSIDIRTASSPGVKGEAIALRILDKGNVALGLGHLGLNPEEEAVIQRLSKLPHGMVLMAGPTGSGKTTTLYSILKGINALEKNILTIEDPVEYELPMIKQTQLNDQAGFTFEVAIRHFLRQDPDILLIGEIRDLVTAKTAFQAAMTGHLVFSTIHTNSAASTVARLLDLGVENYFIPSTVRAIVAQRLIRRLCTKCREQYTPEKEELKEYGLQNGWNPAGKPIFKPTGCEMCGYTGYLGRTGIFEIFNVSPSISKGISDKAPADELERIAIKEGMKTLRDSGLEKAIKGETSLEEVIRVTV